MSRRHGSSQDHDSGTAARKPKRKSLVGHGPGSAGVAISRGKARQGIKRHKKHKNKLPDRSSR